MIQAVLTGRVIDLSKFQPRDVSEKIPASQLLPHDKIKYKGEIWEVTQKKRLGNNYFQVQLKRGHGETAKECNFRIMAHMPVIRSKY